MPSHNHGREPRQFTSVLIDWSRVHPRPMPWLEEDDPYRIWLSEIILQQTQVAQAIPYYRKFIHKYPSVTDLARASEQEVLRDWQGLGYNTRARNLHTAALQVAKEFGGHFPNTYQTLLQLKGVGPYTAAAIASFAFGESVPAIDSNVIRVLCRYLGITEVSSSPAAYKTIRDFLESAITLADPSVFNQALMNFGATSCTPRAPRCDHCPLRLGCQARLGGYVDLVPVRKPKARRRKRYLHYFVMSNRHGVVLRCRTARDIWQHMYDFPLVETESGRVLKKSARQMFVDQYPVASRVVPFSSRDKQLLTHQEVHCLFYRVALKEVPLTDVFPEYRFVYFADLNNFAFPKIVDCYLRTNFDTFINT